MEEHKFIENEDIFISSTRLVIENKTIVMNAICSIELDREEFAIPWFFAGIAVLGLLMALISPFPNINNIGWIIAFIGIFIIIKKWATGRNEAIIIELSSGEKVFIDNEDVKDLPNVFKVLNDVILFRG